ncbi:MAG: hypothetical protein HYZ75_10205 [Elusimicrobia bacterium]|nr:hypothetical protein [Elusimicrobiota bacterium]
MSLTSAVMHLPAARRQGILLSPTGSAPGNGYVWKRVFLKGDKVRVR